MPPPPCAGVGPLPHPLLQRSSPSEQEGEPHRFQGLGLPHPRTSSLEARPSSPGPGVVVPGLHLDIPTLGGGVLPPRSSSPDLQAGQGVHSPRNTGSVQPVRVSCLRPCPTSAQPCPKPHPAHLPCSSRWPPLRPGPGSVPHPSSKPKPRL